MHVWFAGIIQVKSVFREVPNTSVIAHLPHRHRL